MPVSSGVRKRIREFLDPDDELQYVFPADIVGSTNPSVFFAVTRKSITIMTTGYLSRKSPKSVVSATPRNQRIGPVETSTGPWFKFNGVDYEIDDEYVSVVRAADAEIRRDAAKPEDPLPDL
ncbi:hypothetical protein [Amycolatopsis regifaucium]|uniref:YokE-like PH domain-containing protein n=1 Tax=Amycolatopsis regifaucium TaxID=546365 RepID=A0A154MI06_9PSEU|nr:hypothetical protein [Amycolatopsis regifaucium]KZB83996.1 hypothetical protein AVL48_35335 [Amycolatopsis regifaucium]OKA06967.1 hypothetical protein ATP06_0219280 [Amycolatopsis regifaucium]